MKIEDFLDEDASESELAACGLVVELLSTAGVLTLMAQLRIERDVHDGTDEQAVAAVTRRYIELAMPALAAQGVESCLRATGLIEIARVLIVDGMQREAAGQARLN